MKKQSLLIVTFTMLVLTTALGQEPTDSIPKSCTDCHSDLVEQAVMHYPVEDNSKIKRKMDELLDDGCVLLKDFHAKRKR